MMEVECQPAQINQDVEMNDATAAAAIELSVERQLELAEEHAKSSQSTSDRLSQIVAEYRKIQESSAQEIEKKRSAVRSKCQERLWMAGVWRDYQLDIIKRSFDAEVKQIEREYQNEFNSLKDSLMQELQEERKRLQALENATNLSIDRDGNLVEAPQPDTQPASHLTVEEHGTGRRLRRREDKSGHDSTSTGHAAGTTTTTSSRRKQVNNIYTFNTLLQEQDILDDLGVIAKEAGFSAPSRRSGNKATAALIASGAGERPTTQTGHANNVSVEKGVLHYNWDIISSGDRIRIQLSPNTNPINASVQSVTTSELTIATSSGRTVKVPIADLKGGKAVILISGHEHEE